MLYTLKARLRCTAVFPTIGVTCAAAPEIQLPKDEKIDTLAQVAVHFNSMAEDPRGRGLPPRSLRDRPEEPQYPPLPGEEYDRSRGPYRLPLPMACYLPPFDPATRDNYSASPISANSYQGYLPPVKAQPDPRPSHSPNYYGRQRGRDLAYPYQQYPPCKPPLVVPYGKPGPSVSTQQQAAPRQRTSIACIFCRKRKVKTP